MLRGAHQRTHQLAQPRLWLSMMGLMMVVVAVVIPTPVPTTASAKYSEEDL